MVKLNENKLTERAEQTLRACLKGIPILCIAEIKRQPTYGGISPDFLVTAEVSGEEKRLVVEVKNNGQPRVARQAANQLRIYLDTLPDAYGIFVAPYISEQAADICRKEGVGYADLAGNCLLYFDGIYVERKGNSNPFSVKRSLHSLYSPKAERVLRALLGMRGRIWNTRDLADETRVSFGEISNVRKLLADREWIQDKRRGFVLIEPLRLLSEWGENYSFRRNKARDFYTLRNISEIERQLCDICLRKGIRCALTGFSGAARLAPAVRYQRAMAYVEDSEVDVAALLPLKEVPSGPNLTLLAPYDEGVFYGERESDGTRIVSSTQIYLDLLSFRGRGKEAADFLLEHVIEPGWQHEETTTHRQ